ncbi:MAG: hypothetical protein NTY22_05910, partial [Proteobacteria bacterium]|nr:hypothetical protein [Pseudomonadota bacterium]
MVRKLFLKALILMIVVFTTSSCLEFAHTNLSNNDNGGGNNNSGGNNNNGGNNGGENNNSPDIYPPGIGEVDLSQLNSSAPVIVSWDPSFDYGTPLNKLKYKLVKSLDASTINTLQKADSITGDDLIMDWTANTTSYSVSGLLPETTYYFAVLVKDETGNKAIYTKMKHPIWKTVGSSGFSDGQAEYTSLAIDSNNTPYVAYTDYENSYKATVQKFNGTSWEIVGSAGFSDGQVDYISLAIDSNNTPYVAYRNDTNSYKATVQKFNGTSWEIVGSAGFSGGGANYISLAIDSNNTPYVAYQDCENSCKTTVQKFNSTSWEVVGSAEFSDGEVAYTSLAIDSSNIPYVAYTDYANSGKTTVQKFNGTSWEAVGAPGFSDDAVNYTSLAIDSNGTPYVAYQSAANSYVTVKTLLAIHYTTRVIDATPPVGSGVYFSQASGFDPVSISWDPATDNITPQIELKYKLVNSLTAPIDTIAKAENSNILMDWSENTLSFDASDLLPNTTYYFAVLVKDIDGNKDLYSYIQWPNVDNPGFSRTPAYCISLAIDSNGTPYVAYQ